MRDNMRLILTVLQQVIFLGFLISLAKALVYAGY